ncbi:arabinose-proton symporter [Nilaparvata lugens]|uniref:arabinose-proton symporter n=1 Tax=Nilaparvata lugens TaxID=108931 RepID=UPI00193C9D1A|nr:arabinose-proton symporter [Nilaparvata lugens]
MMRKLHGYSFYYEKASNKFSRIGVCVGCGLYCFTSGLEHEFSLIEAQRIEQLDELPFSWSQEYWQMMGSLLGCLVSGIALCCMGRLSSLLRISLPCLILASISTYISTQVDIHSSIFLFSATLQIFLQNMSRSLAVTVTPIYILETICHYPGGQESRAMGALIALTQLPLAVSSLLATGDAQALSASRVILVLPALASVAALVLCLCAPESPRWLMQNNGCLDDATKSLLALRPRSVTHNQIAHELDQMRNDIQMTSLCKTDSYIKPLLTLSGFVLLIELMGYKAYNFYMDWALTFSGLTMNSRLVSSFIRLVSLVMSTVVSSTFPGPNSTALMLLISSGSLAFCLSTLGCSFYFLEFSTTKLMWVPATFLIIYQVFFWLGIGTYSMATCALLCPARSRCIVLILVVIVHQMASYFCQLFLPMMMSVLHPFGVFWFHAVMTSIALAYISVVIVPELKFMAKNVSVDQSVQQYF